MAGRKLNINAAQNKKKSDDFRDIDKAAKKGKI